MAGEFRSEGEYAIVEVQSAEDRVVSRKLICSKWLLELQGRTYCYIYPGDAARQLQVAEERKDASHPQWILQPVWRIVEYTATYEEAFRALEKRSRNQRHKQKGYSAAYTSGEDFTEGSASNGEDDLEYIDKIAAMAPPQLPAFPKGAVATSNASAAARKASATTNGEQNAKRKIPDDSNNLRKDFPAVKRLRFSSSSSSSSSCSRDEDVSRVDPSTADSPDLSIDRLATHGSHSESLEDDFTMERMPFVPRAPAFSERPADPPISQSTPISSTASSFRKTTRTSMPNGVSTHSEAPSTQPTPQATSLERAHAVKQLSQALKVLANVNPEEMTDSAKLVWLMARQMETDRTICSLRLEQEQLSRRVPTGCCSGRRGVVAIGADEDQFNQQFPFSDIDKMRNLDTLLGNSKTARDKYRAFLSKKMDSKDYKASVNNVLADIITNKLGSTKLTAKGRKEEHPDPAKRKFGVMPMHLWKIARQIIMAKHAIQERDLIDNQLDVWMRGRAEAVRRGR